MPIPRSQAKSLVGKLACLNYFPSERSALKQLVDTVGDCIHSKEHGDAVLRQIIESVPNCPVPMEIRRVAHDLAPNRPRGACPQCHGKGLVRVSLAGQGTMAPCSCRTAPQEVA
ncbi:MAG: hypothetical protein GY906_22685 [bacterium]|nr:hypothetical protein [bacterium]